MMKKKTKIMELKLFASLKRKGIPSGAFTAWGKGMKKVPAMESQGTGARRGAWRLIKG